MKIDKENNNFIFMGKYLSGEASPEEAMIFHEWLKDPKNNEEYSRLLSLWKRFPTTIAENQPNLMHEWNDLEKALLSHNKAKQKGKPIYHYFVAASVITLIAAINFIWLNGSNRKEKQKEEITFFTKKTKNNIINETLPDSSQLTINRNSSIAYATTFNKEDRELMLKGEAFFDVAHNEAMPFVITVGDLKIRVIGTSFNIKEDSEKNYVEIQVHQGVVKMYISEKELMLKKGQSGTYLTINRQLTFKNSIDINSMSYATKTFSFHDLSLAAVSGYLEDAFGVKFSFDKLKFKECRITADFTNKSLDYILDVLDATLNTTHLKKELMIYLNGQGCQ